MSFHFSRRRRALARFRRLDLQQLELRTVLAPFTVSTLVDESDGVFTDGDLSLRETIEQANLTTEHDTISFKQGLTGTISLTTENWLEISKDLTINGPGASQLTVSGNDVTRVFTMYNAGNPLSVSLSGFAIADGSGFVGGGIAADAGTTLTLNRMYLHDNTADQGGAIGVINAKLNVLNSTLTRNVSTGGGGGAIFMDGGGPQDPAQPHLQVINSDISDNDALYCGGVYVFDAATRFTNCTIVRNDASSGIGGGIFTYSGVNSFTTLRNTIVAGNTRAGVAHDLDGNVQSASANNVIGDAATAGGLTHGNSGNIVGNAGAGTIDLYKIVELSLNNNGGSTLTHALVTGSPALDAGNNALALDQNGAALTGDQRNFTRIVDGPDAGTTATVDIGAYEAAKRTLVVNTLVDEYDQDHGPGDFSLREALERANANAGLDVVNFAAGLVGPIKTTGSRMSISDSVAVNGPGADKLIVDGTESFGTGGMFNIGSPSSVSISVTLSGLGITGGETVAVDGGGISVSGADLVLNRMHIFANTSSIGGGIAINGSSQPTTVTILNSTIAGNTAGQGAGINQTGGSASLLVINSTLSGNTASFDGGAAAIFGGTATFRNCTITGNHASAATSENGVPSGGGIRTLQGALLHNTIVADNTRDDPAVPDDLFSNVAAGSSNNLIGDAGSAGGLTSGTNGNIVGQNGTGTIDIAAVLDTSLANNGGTTPTHKLLFGSPALDKGNNAQAVDQNAAALTVDQRGLPRLADRDGNGVATVDIGAVELGAFALSLSGTITYTEDGEPLILASGATLAATENGTFNTGKLTVTNAVTPHADDRLIVRHQGVGAGQVGTSGSNVTYGGVLIGTKTGGSGATPLVVTFNGDATPTAIQAVVRRIAFSSISNHPPIANRSIRFVVRDGAGAFTNTATKTVQVVRVNDPPGIGSFGSALTYTEDTAAIGVAVSATVSDIDSFNFDTGKLSARISANAESSDRLSIRNLGGVSTSSNEVIVGGEVIGTFTGGSGSTALVVTFNSLASAADVQAVLRALAFRNASQNPSATARTLSVFVNDGDGGTSLTSTKSISVTPKNDKPVLGGISGSVGYARDSAAIVLAGNATVTDVDSDNFAGGRLQVSVDPSDPSNRLSIAGGFTVDASNNVKLGSTIIGKRTANGFGANELIVTFNSNATKAIVQQLVRAITFKTVAGSAGSRQVNFTVSDGDGGLSTEVSKTVNVS